MLGRFARRTLQRDTHLVQSRITRQDVCPIKASVWNVDCALILPGHLLMGRKHRLLGVDREVGWERGLEREFRRGLKDLVTVERLQGVGRQGAD
jgi:hypothetical protein